jgi:hypothetical protein
MPRTAFAALALAAALPLPAAAQRAPEPPAAYRTPDPGLVAWYPLDGDAVDRVTRAPARAVGTRPVDARDGGPRGALGFDGGRSYVDLGERLQPARFTLSAWIRPDAVDRTQVIVSKLENLPAHAYRNFELRLEAGGRLFLHVPSGAGWEAVTGTRAIAPGRWTHVAATYDGVRAQLWVDGGRDGAPINITYAQSQTPTWIGARPESGGRDGRTPSGPTFFFAGAIEDVRIHDRALAEGELVALAREPVRDDREPAPRPGPRPPPRGEEAELLAWYPLDGDARDVAGRADGAPVGTLRPTEDRRGDPRGAVAFGSKDAYVNVGVRTEPERFTLAAWVRPARVDRDQVILSKWSSTQGPKDRYLELRLEAGGRVVLTLPSGGFGRPQAIRSARVLSAGRWVHLAATYDGDQAVLYVDGDADADAAAPPYDASPGPIFLGARPDPSGKKARLGTGLDGRLDDVRLYRGAADADAVAGIFQDRTRPPRSPPGDRDDREDGAETALLLRIDGLAVQHDEACLRRSVKAVLAVEARALALLDEAERAARAERNGRLSGYLRRAGQELQGVRGQVDAASLDRRRSALASLAESIWGDLATDLDDEPFAREVDDRHDADRRAGPWK